MGALVLVASVGDIEALCAFAMDSPTANTTMTTAEGNVNRVCLDEIRCDMADLASVRKSCAL
jgi:hypothetical protein